MSESGEDVFSVEGSFDAVVAYKLRDQIAACRGDLPIVLDFRCALDIHDLGIAVLADGLIRDGIRADFRGLSQHHERILRYLGFDADREEQFTQPAG